MQQLQTIITNLKTKHRVYFKKMTAFLAVMPPPIYPALPLQKIGESEFITCDHLDPHLQIIQIELYALQSHDTGLH